MWYHYAGHFRDRGHYYAISELTVCLGVANRYNELVRKAHKASALAGRQPPWSRPLWYENL